MHINTGSEYDKPTLKELRKQYELSKKDLSELSGVSVNAITAAEDPNHRYKTNYSVALLLAEALYVEVCDIRWLRGLSNIGRPALTGRKITIVIEQQSKQCPIHFVALTPKGACPYQDEHE